MDIPKDPAMLLSFVNLKLRDYYKSFDSDVYNSNSVNTKKEIDPGITFRGQ